MQESEGLLLFLKISEPVHRQAYESHGVARRSPGSLAFFHSPVPDRTAGGDRSHIALERVQG